MNIIITKSTRKDKKLMAIINNNKTIHFGATGFKISPLLINKLEMIKNVIT